MTDTDHDNKKPGIKISTLVSEVFSWSLSDVLNKNLYSNKVCKTSTIIHTNSMTSMFLCVFVVVFSNLLLI